ncbi:MAG: hypothetical protein JO331_04525 [Verrucomicrobia bacterium]|nr:hypothetical protein [Verrucomicrobiota bacterium]
MLVGLLLASGLLGGGITKGTKSHRMIIENTNRLGEQFNCCEFFGVLIWKSL